MKISVVIPCFNAADTIAEQLEALVSQSVQPWEVIISDNGSTDNSIAIANQYRDRLPRFKVVYATQRKGASHARNVGAKATTGDYLAFCDADDVVTNTWLEALQTAFKEHNFVASCFDYVKLNGNNVNCAQTRELQNFRVPFLPFAGGCGLGIKRSLHMAVNGFDEGIRYLEDADYCLRVQLAGEPLTFVKNAVIYIRCNAPQPQSFLRSRQASFEHGYNWGTGLALLYKRYRQHGMVLHGILPRLAVSSVWLLRCLASGFSCGSTWKMGWHTGILRGFLQYGIYQI